MQPILHHKKGINGKYVLSIVFFILMIGFSLRTIAQAPASCAAATSLTIGTVTSDQSFTDATVNDPTPASCGVSSFTRDGWFKVVATATTRMSVLFTNSSTRDGALFVYSGTCGAGLVFVACANNNTTSGDESVTFPATSGATYFIRVGRVSGTTGANLSGTLLVKNLIDAANDCAAALTLTQQTTYTGGDYWLNNATQSITPGGCTSTSALDVWFKFIAASTNPSIRVTGGPNFDAIIELRSGACPTTFVSCTDAGSDGETETVTASGLTIGATYYVRVYDFNSSGSALPLTQEFQIGVFGTCATPAAPTSGGNVTICTNVAPGTVSATPPAGHVIDWYSAATGGTLLASNSNTYSSSTAGTFYALSRNPFLGCVSSTRTGVTLTISPLSVGGSVAGSTSVCSGTNSGSLTLSGQTGSITKWQFSTNADLSSPTDIGNITTSQSYSNLTATRYYWAVITSGSCPSTTSSVATVTVTPLSTITLMSGAGSNTQTPCIGNAITTITYQIGGSATGATISGTLPLNVTSNYNSGTKVFTIQGTPNAAGNTSYIVTATGPCPVTASGTINVLDNSTLANGTSPNQTVCISTAITPITYQVGGAGTGATLSGLPGTFSSSYNSTTKVFTISGTPTAAGSFPYTVTTTGPCINPSLGGTITVTGNSTLSLAAGGSNIQSVCANTAITTINYTVGGTATSASATGLPTGVTGVYAPGSFTISGSPTVSGVFNYSVTTVGPCADPIMTGTITSNLQPTAPNITPATSTICLNSSVPLTGSATISSVSTVSSENFNTNGSFIYAAAGTSTSSGYAFTQKTSPATIGFTGITNTDGSRFMLAGVASVSSSSTNSTLTSPVINTTAYTSLSLSFRHTYTKTSEAGVSVQVSTNGGPWSNISTTGTVILTNTFTSTQGNNNTFLTVNIPLNSYINNSNFQIRFNYVANVGFGTGWWGIDDVTLNGSPLPLLAWTANTGSPINGLPANAGSYLATNSNISVTPTATTTYTLTAKDPVTNCFSTVPTTAIVNVNNVNGGTIGTDQTICYAADAGAFTSVADGTGQGAITYRWEKSVSPFNTWNTIGAATSSVFDESTLTQTTKYRRVTISTLNAIPCEALSNVVTVTVPTAAVNATVAFTQITCNGFNNGTITISSPVGGFGNYQYSINGGSSWENSGSYQNLIAGTYDAQVRDKDHTSCVKDLNNAIVISDPLAISGSASVTTAILCNGGTGTVTITASGGTGQLSYTFNAQTNNSGIFNGVSAGVDLPYSVTDANNCGSFNGTITVTEPAAVPAPTSGGNQTVCEDGNPTQTLTATATGGIITWYDAATNGNEVITPDLVGVGTATYYAEAFDGTCSSHTRTPVILTINEAPVASANDQTVCSDGTLTQTLIATATGGTITWYDAATNGNVVTPTQVGVGVSTYYAEAFDGTCTSLTRAAVVLTINPVPDAPLSGGDQTVCENGNPTQTLTATATGGTITWYDAATNGNVVTPTQVGVGTSTYYAEASDGTCSSLSRTAVTLTITAAPSAPVASDQTVCEDGNPTQTLTATATGGTITWYDAATNGNIVTTPELVGVGTVTYYAESFDGSCTSLTRTPVVLTINAAPAAPISGGDQTVCSDGSLTQTLTATATGGTITWYDAATNGNVVTPTQVGVGTSTYYAESFDGTCSSLARTAVTLTINAAPSAPVASDQTVCEDGNPTQTLTATATGGTITWYDASTNGNVVTTPELVGVGTVTYYAEAFDGTCSSLARTAVTLTINAAPAAPTASNQTVCSDGTLTQTLTATATGGTITWYDAATNGNVVTPTQVGVGVSTYYAEAFDGTCTSLTRTAVVLTINPVPDAPLSGGDQTVCENGNPTQTLTATATGGTITWYDAATNGNVVTPTQVGVGTSTYYAEASDGTCSSLSRTAVTLTITAAPSAPVASDQTVCEDGNPTQTLTATATGGTITWYDAATNGNIVTTPELVGVGTVTYYAESFDGSCTSLTRTPVVLTINAAPAAPISGGDQTVCSDGSLTQTLTATATGETITWYDAATNGNVVTPTQVGVGTSTYYAESFDGTCSSLTRTAVTLIINPLPATPGVTVTQPNCFTATGSITVDTPTGVGFQYNIGAGYQNSPVFPGLNANTYSILVKNNFGCVSAIPATAIVNPQPFVPGPPVVTGPVNVCAYVGNGTPVTYTANADGAANYSWVLPPNVNTVSSTANSITVTFLNGFTAQANKQIRVAASSACGTSQVTIYYLLSQLPNLPTAIVGSTSVCTVIDPIGGTFTYTTHAVPAATEYIWTTQAGTTTVSHPNGAGVNDTTITVSFSSGFTSSPITVQAKNDCGLSPIRSLNLTKINPGTPGLITGPTNVCANITPGPAATYKVSSVITATSYNWNVTAPGAVITHPNGPGATDTVVNIVFPSFVGTTSVTVSASNGCGTGGTRSLSVTKLVPGTPGKIDVEVTQPCPNRLVQYKLGAESGGIPTNATSLVWKVPSQGTIVSDQFTGTLRTTIVVSYSGAVDSVVTVQAFNNCGSSSIRFTAAKYGVCAPPERPLMKGAVVSNPMTEMLNVKVFPNPSVSDFKLQVLTAGKEQIHVRILDIQGRELKTLTVMPYQTITIGSELKPGSYIIETKQGDQVKTVKVIKF